MKPISKNLGITQDFCETYIGYNKKSKNRLFFQKNLIQNLVQNAEFQKSEFSGQI